MTQLSSLATATLLSIAILLPETTTIYTQQTFVTLINGYSHSINKLAEQNSSKLALSSSSSSSSPSLSDNKVEDCPDQAHWIFVGILLGLVVGILTFWLLDCFHFRSSETEVTSNSSELPR